MYSYTKMIHTAFITISSLSFDSISRCWTIVNAVTPILLVPYAVSGHPLSLWVPNFAELQTDKYLLYVRFKKGTDACYGIASVSVRLSTLCLKEG